MTQSSDPLLLNHDEALLMSCGSFHATNKRVIRVGRRSGSEILESIAYRELDSVENLSVPRIQTIGLSLLVILLTVLVGPDGLIRAGCFMLGAVGVAVGSDLIAASGVTRIELLVVSYLVGSGAEHAITERRMPEININLYKIYLWVRNSIPCWCYY